MKKENIFWIAGENSGDLHSSIVLKKLKEMGKEYNHIGIGGHLMQTEGFTPLFSFKRFAVMGFWEVLKHLRFFMKVEKEIRDILTNIKPSLVVLVDYPGFNLRIAQMAYDMDIPVLYYICPQFWAWHHSRVDKLKAFTNNVAAILPFETELLDIHRVTSQYVGHPIAEEIKIETDKEQFAQIFGLDLEKKWIGFIPGSRDAEITKLLPEFMKALKKFDENEYCFLISKAHTIHGDLFWRYIPKRANIFIIDGYTYEMMKYCEIMAVTSGTATLEAAFIGTPFVIAYKTSFISYYIAKNLVKIKRIGLPNIILEQDLVPELIQEKANGDLIYKTMEYYLANPEKLDEMRSELLKVRELLSEKTTSTEVANMIIKMIDEQNSIQD